MKSVKRGYVPEDKRQFDETAVQLLQQAQQDLCYLLNHAYPMRQAVTFIGNHFQLSARQRTALMRTTCSNAARMNRKTHELTDNLADRTLFIDGFNVIITLETALSGSTLLYSMDGTVRDLCGLHGTYRLIDKTVQAIALIREELERLQADNIVFILDAQISNSGRLKCLLNEQLREQFNLDVCLSNHADSLLSGKNCIATSDSGILDKCDGWVNLVYPIIKKNLSDVRPIDLSSGLEWR